QSGDTAVMYLGRIVERAPTGDLVASSQHPYTRALLAAIPEPDPDLTRAKPKVALRSLEIPSLLRLPSGCTFHPRCPLFEPGLCDVVSPGLVWLNAGREVACHVVEREAANGMVAAALGAELDERLARCTSTPASARRPSAWRCSSSCSRPGCCCCSTGRRPSSRSRCSPC